MNSNEEQVKNRKHINERRTVRRSCKIRTDFSVKDRICLGIITDISPYGAFIKSLDIFQPGEIVRMVIKSKNANLRHSGTIKWSNQIGFGLQFKTV